MLSFHSDPLIIWYLIIWFDLIWFDHLILTAAQLADSVIDVRFLLYKLRQSILVIDPLNKPTHVWTWTTSVWPQCPSGPTLTIWFLGELSLGLSTILSLILQSPLFHTLGQITGSCLTVAALRHIRIKALPSNHLDSLNHKQYNHLMEEIPA